MPQNNPITIKDGAATPVDHVFNPVSTGNGVARFENQASSASLEGREVLSIFQKRPQPRGRTTFENVVSLDFPKVVTGTGTGGTPAEIKIYTNRGYATFVVDPRSTAEERKNARVMLANAILNPTIAQAVDNAETFW